MNKTILKTILLPIALSCFCLPLRAAEEGVTSSSSTGVICPKDITLAQALGFEREGAWLSVPPDLLEQMEKSGITESQLSCANVLKYKQGAPIQPGITFITRAAGVQLSREHVTQGAYSGKWANHQLYPSIICERVPTDWSGFKTFAISIYSEVNTGEEITLGILSDNPETPWKDWYFYHFTVDWKGLKRLEIPLSAFVPFQKPLGWSNIGAIGFFTKAFGHQPSPTTTLWLDDITLSSKLPAVAVSEQAATNVTADAFSYTQAYYEKPTRLNHPFPEIALPSPEVAPGKPIQHGHYFCFERAVYDYYPRFQPGYVSFDPEGKAYIKAGDRIQWLDENGQWIYCDLGPVLSAWGKANGWAGMVNDNAPNQVDPMIRFDRDGDTYILQQVTKIDKEGKPSQNIALLLHSRDRLHTWTVNAVPGGRWANFEKLDGYNTSALDHPPVILNGNVVGANMESYLVLPVKNSDGTLNFDRPYKYAENAIVGNIHSGDANLAISVGDKIYIVWGWCPEPSRYPEIVAKLKKAGDSGSAIGTWGGGGWTWLNLKNTAVGATCPPIPEDHPAFAMSFKHFKSGPKSVLNYAKEGVPTFVSVFDRNTKSFDTPVFVGFGGSTLDGHNSGAITVDSKGYLTVLINGHHDPLVYTRSLNPLDATAWSVPQYIHGEHDRVSYSTLTCDRSDTLYSVDRCTSDAYNNSLSLLRQKAGEKWEPERILVWPFKSYYMAWSQKMTYDRTKDRLYLTYFCNGSGQQLTVDQYEFFIFQHPDQEPRVAANQGTKKDGNPGRILPYPPPSDRRSISFYYPELSECSILVSSDHGETWHLATTDDFK